MSSDDGEKQRRSAFDTGYLGPEINGADDYWNRINTMAGGSLSRPNSASGSTSGTQTPNPFEDRQTFARNLTSQENKDQLYQALKYPADDALDFDQYFARYLRQDIARGILSKPVNDTWQQTPQINDREGDANTEDPETDFESDIRQFFNNSAPVDLRSSPLQRMIAADILASLGEFAVIVFGFSDSSDLSSELSEDALSDQGLEGISYIDVFPENQVEMNIIEDMNEDRYGRVDTYEITRESDGGGGGSTTTVHHSRAIHVVQGALMDPLRGVPFFQPIVNRLIDSDKILGGSAEGYWRGGYQGYVIRPPKDSLGRTLQFTNSESLAQEIQEYTENYSRTIATTGQIQPLDSNVSTPEPHMNEQWKAISAALDFPQSVLTGTQTGERATTEDSKQWSQTISSRRNTYAEPSILRPIVELLVLAGVISTPDAEEFVINWAPLDEPDEKEQAEIASNLASAMASASGGQPGRLFSDGEIRRLAFDVRPERGSEAPTTADSGTVPNDPTAEVGSDDPATDAQVTREADGSNRMNEQVMSPSDRSYDSPRYNGIEDYYIYKRYNASEDELDEVYSDFTDAVNMSASQLQDWDDHPCSREASKDPSAVIGRNMRLLEKSKSDWDTKDIKDAKRTINFVDRMKGAMGENPSDGKTVESDGQEYSCPSKAVISLRNWAYDPLGRYNSRANASWTEGTPVDHGGGLAVITAKMTSNFSNPKNDEQVEASSDNPAYIVATSDGFSVLREDDLKEYDGETDDVDPAELGDADTDEDGRENAHPWYDQVSDPFDQEEVDYQLALYRADADLPDDVVDRSNAGDPYVGFRNLPNGWDRTSVLKAWVSLGGTWTTCTTEMQGDIRSPKQFCSKLKDEVLGTEKWRGRF